MFSSSSYVACLLVYNMLLLSAYVSAVRVHFYVPVHTVLADKLN